MNVIKRRGKGYACQTQSPVEQVAKRNADARMTGSINMSAINSNAQPPAISRPSPPAKQE